MTPLSLLLVSTFFASPKGDDGAAGTAKAPLRTVAAAVRKARGGRVVLLPGTYPIEATIEIGEADRGLTIVAQKPGAARLLGGRILRRWTPSGWPRILVCDLARDEPIPDLGTMSRRGMGLPGHVAGLELFYNGKPMPLARYPNAGWLRTGATTGDKAFVVADEHAKAIRGDDVWALGYWRFDWAESYERADLKDGALTLGESPVFGLAAGRRYVILNALSELDAPGEWYLDRPAKRLYFWPPTDRGEAVASTLNGPMFHMKEADDVTLRGLCLEVGRAGAVRVEGGTKDRIENCLIRNFGNDGVAFVGGTDSGIAGCDLTGLGDRAITLNGGDRKTLAPARLYADDNHVWAYSRWTRTYQPAIGIGGVGNRAARNLIEDAPHNAVLLSGNDHLLEGNDVRRVCLETGDSGAFYMGRDPTMRGTVIRNNRFRDLGARVETEGNFTEVMSVYLDDGYPGTTIVGNVFEGPGTGIMLGGGQDNTVEGNVFVGKNPAVHLDARGRGWAKDMIVNPGEWDFEGKLREVDGPFYAARYPAMKDLATRGFRDPTGTRIVGNVSVGGRWLRLQDGLTTKDFVDERNVERPSGALQDALKVIPIDLAKIGLRTKKGRPSELTAKRRSP